MEFPVDVLLSGRHEDLESSAQSYMNKLLYSNPDNTQCLTLPSMRKVKHTTENRAQKMWRISDHTEKETFLCKVIGLSN